MSRKDQKRKYLQEKVNPVVERMITDLLVDMPNDVVGYLKKWLETKSAEHGQAKKSLVSIQPHDSPHDSEDEDDEEELEDLPDKEQLIEKHKHKSCRTSVSAEVYGKYNEKKEYQAKFVQKTQEQKDEIRKRLSQAFMFSALDENEQNIVIDAMEEQTFQPEEWVIKQGDRGDLLYVVDSGKLACYKKFGENAEPTFLKNYEPGESFGELALLYNAPRAASIKAIETSVLFALDRETFNHIVKDAAIRKRNEYEQFLSNLELLSNMDNYERMKIADAVKRIKVPAGTYIVKEGEAGDTFYFIEEGEAVATKTMTPGEEPKEVYQYKVGGYFGELALLNEVPRQANVIAKTDLKLAALDRMSFKRLLGPLEEILKRNMKNYEKFTV